MSQQTSPFIEAKFGWAYGESGWNDGMDENLVKFSFLFDANITDIVGSLPVSPANGDSYFLTTDNRFYFRANNTWYDSPCPKNFVFSIKSTGQMYQYDGTNAITVDSNSGLGLRVTNIETTLSTLGSAAFEDSSNFASPSDISTLTSALDSLSTDVSDIEAELNGSQTLSTTPSKFSTVNARVSAETKPHYVVSKQYTPGDYSHFGIMDKLSSGQLYLMMRKGTTHQDDLGSIVMVKQLPDGTWGDLTTVISSDLANNLDTSGVAGGTLPNGKLVAVGWYRYPISSVPTNNNRDMFVMVSDDQGLSWVKKATFTVTTGTDYKIPYGKVRTLEDGRSVVCFYQRNPSDGSISLKGVVTADGGETWTDTFSIITLSENINETDILPLGGGYVLAVSRAETSPGFCRVFFSSNGGTTWTDRGTISTPDGEGTAVYISPSLEYFKNASGTPFVALLYTNRTTSQLVYRTISVESLIANGQWSYRSVIYSAPNESGYQTTVVSNNQILGNLFRATTANTVVGAYQFELRPGDMPDYDSGYFAVTATTTFTKAHNFAKFPSRVIVEWSSAANGTGARVDQGYVLVSGVLNTAGCVTTVDTTNIVVYTGTYTFSGTGFGFTGNQTAGFYRIRAWR